LIKRSRKFAKEKQIKLEDVKKLQVAGYKLQDERKIK